MDDWHRFNDQFRETEWERRERWTRRKREHIDRGECWQCGKPFEKCECSNLKRAPASGHNGG